MDLALLKVVVEQKIPFNHFMGVQAVSIEHGRVRLELPFREELLGDWVRKAIHGGVISMLADVAGGFAIWSTLDDPTARVSTIDLRVDYLRPGKPERLVAEGIIVRVGGRVGVSDIRLFHPDAEDQLVATGKGVYAIKVPKSH
ncbi:hotdog fold thioesterase [Chondromyces crocatus]|nr:hotdog fold thioesterase [Chondromyces crocatus]